MPKKIIEEIEEDQNEIQIKPKRKKKIKKTVVNQQQNIVVDTNQQKVDQQPQIVPQKQIVKQNIVKKNTLQTTIKTNTPNPLQIFVSGIPYQATDEQITNVFTECGNITSIKIPRYQDSGRCIGYCHIEFQKQKEVKKAIAKNGVTMGTRYLKVERATGEKTPVQSTQAPPIGCKTLFVKNLSYETTEEDVRKLFQRCGKIVNVRLVYDKFHNHFKGFCYIDFADPSGVKSGLKMNGIEHEGRKLLTQFSALPPKKGYKGFKKERTNNQQIQNQEAQ